MLYPDETFPSVCSFIIFVLKKNTTYFKSIGCKLVGPFKIKQKN